MPNKLKPNKPTATRSAGNEEETKYTSSYCDPAIYIENKHDTAVYRDEARPEPDQHLPARTAHTKNQHFQLTMPAGQTSFRRPA